MDAEEAAADHLRATGWCILARNWRGAGAELDIVARRQGVLAFVEVKARSWGHAAGMASVDGRKRSRLRRAAGVWLAGYTGSFTSCTFVVASMRPILEGWDMVWLFDAFDV